MLQVACSKYNNNYNKNRHVQWQQNINTNALKQDKQQQHVLKSAN